MAAAGFFCLMCGYYTLRPMREALALEVGVQYNSILFSVVLVVLGGAAARSTGGWSGGRRVAGCCGTCRRHSRSCSSRWPRASLVSARQSTWHSCISSRSRSANLYVISVFWSAMADVWRPELAKRFYGYIAAGGSAGALLGPLIVQVAGAQHRADAAHRFRLRLHHGHGGAGLRWPDVRSAGRRTARRYPMRQSRSAVARSTISAVSCARPIYWASPA